MGFSFHTFNQYDKTFQEVPLFQFLKWYFKRPFTKFVLAVNHSLRNEDLRVTTGFTGFYYSINAEDKPQLFLTVYKGPDGKNTIVRRCDNYMQAMRIHEEVSALLLGPLSVTAIMPGHSEIRL